MTALHPRSSADPRMLRWITATALPAELPALDGLVADGVLERAEIGAGEIRTWLAEGRTWDDAGPLVRSTLFAALREVPACPELTADQLTERIAELIRNGQVNEIKEAMENSLSKESQTFEQSLYKLYKDGKISLDEAMLNADSPTNLHWLINNGQSQEEMEAESNARNQPSKGSDEGPAVSFDIDLIDTPH